MNITGKDLKDLIPDGQVFSIDGINMHSRSDDLVVLNLECSEGGMSIIAYKKAVGKLLMRNAGAAAPAPSPAPVAAKAAEVESEPPAAADDSEESSGRRIGMTRRKDGRIETLKGFTASGSIREKPANCDRRVKHPETGEMVWAIWEA